jgi:hypothetical protein
LLSLADSGGKCRAAPLAAPASIFPVHDFDSGAAGAICSGASAANLKRYFYLSIVMRAGLSGSDPPIHSDSDR